MSADSDRANLAFVNPAEHGPRCYMEILNCIAQIKNRARLYRDGCDRFFWEHVYSI